MTQTKKRAIMKRKKQSTDSHGQNNKWGSTDDNAENEKNLKRMIMKKIKVRR